MHKKGSEKQGCDLQLNKKRILIEGSKANEKENEAVDIEVNSI